MKRYTLRIPLEINKTSIVEFPPVPCSPDHCFVCLVALLLEQMVINGRLFHAILYISTETGFYTFLFVLYSLSCFYKTLANVLPLSTVFK